MPDNPSSESNEKRTVPTEKEQSHTPLLLESIDPDDQHRVSLILDEFVRGFGFVKQYSKSVSFFGSSRTPAGAPDYEDARTLASRIVQESGYSIITGGGPGIMEAANRGACEGDGDSLGLTIKLPHEQTTNAYVRNSIDFHYFFIRKVMLAFSAEAYVFYPGGFGTMDELFELLTLIQTNKVKPVPIFLVDNGHWHDFDRYVHEELYENETIDKEDMDIYTITDDHDEIVRQINEADVQTGVPYEFGHAK